MDFNKVAVSLSIGLGIGLAVILVTTIIFLPVSYVMNRFIYHHPVLRLLLGFFTLTVAPIAFFIILFNPAINYFGLMPLFNTTPSKSQEEGGFVLPLFYKCLTVVLHPFVEFNDAPNDAIGYKKTIEHLFAAKGEPVVNEELMAKITAAGTNTNKAQWESAMTALIPELEGVVNMAATVANVAKDITAPAAPAPVAAAAVAAEPVAAAAVEPYVEPVKTYNQTTLIPGHEYDKITGDVKEPIGVFKGEWRVGSPQANAWALIFEKDGKQTQVDTTGYTRNNFDIKETTA